MKVALLHGPRDLRIEDEPDLEGRPGPGEVDVRTLATALSAGTELAVYTARFGVPFYGWPWGFPTELGYLNVGRVVAVGAGVEAVAPGTIVFALQRHRQAYRLRAGDFFVAVPAGLAPELAAFSYLLNLGLHALRRGGLVPGERVAVVGLGAIGLGAVALAHAFGAPVLAVDPVPERRALAEAVGADRALDPTAGDFTAGAAAFGGEPGIDLVVEAAGTWPALQTAAELVRPEGRIAIVALHPGPAEFNPVGELFYRKQLTLVSTAHVPRQDYPPERVRFTLRRNLADIFAGLLSGRVRYGPAITHRIHYTELPAMFERLASGDRTVGGVAVRWE